MALWFVSDATSPITVTIYDVSIVIVYDVTLLLSMTYYNQSRLGKTDCTDIWVIKLKNQVSPSIGFWVPHYDTIHCSQENVMIKYMLSFTESQGFIHTEALVRG